MLPFPNRHIVFLQKIHVALIGLKVYFFAKRFHILVKEHQDYFSLRILIQRQVSLLTCKDQHGRLHPLSKTQHLSTETTKFSPRHPETIKSDDTQRPTWSSETFVKDSTSVNWDYWSLPSSSRDNQVRWHTETNMVVCTLRRRLNICRPRLLKSPLIIQRQSSPMTCRDQYGHLHPLSKTQRLSTETTEVSPCHPDIIKSNDTETNMVVCTLCQILNVCRPRLLKSPLVIQRQASPMTRRDQYGRSMTLNVFWPRLLQSPLRHPKAFKSDGVRRL